MPSPARLRGNVFVPEYLVHDTRNSKVGIISLFPYREGKKWYTFDVGSMNGDWDELKDKFCLAFFLCPISALYQGQSSISSNVRRSL
jgi:hypothetical protein